MVKFGFQLLMKHERHYANDRHREKKTCYHYQKQISLDRVDVNLKRFHNGRLCNKCTPQNDELISDLA
jgi:hypothetical protein